eukprot:SAG11_NODE_639_length_8017_cov_4.086259_3_plen_167_part_00
MQEFLGRLMAGAILSDENIVLHIPPFVFKKLVGYPCTLEDYCRSIDQSVAKYSEISLCSRDEFELQFEDVFTFEIERSDGLLYSLVENGAATAVTLENRAEFVRAALEARLTEMDAQIDAIRHGLLSACIPDPVLGLWTADEIQASVCGASQTRVQSLCAISFRGL